MSRTRLMRGMWVLLLAGAALAGPALAADTETGWKRPVDGTGPNFSADSTKAADTETGWKSLFDGKTLTGWKAPDTSYWSVEGGAITGKITAEHPLKVNQYLIWQGEQLADFELKITFRMTGSPGINSGFQYRSKLLPNNDIAGYQMDNNRNTDWLCRLYDEHGRDTLAFRGTRTVFDASGKATGTPIPDAGGPAWFKLEEWHEYHLICQGPHMILKVNGRLAAEVVDNDPKQQDFVGILGLQLHSGPPTVAQFKDIRLKVLKAADVSVPALAAAPPQPAAAPQAKPAPAKLGPATSAPPLAAIRDKTLVAWVAPANLTQKGGSVLTIENGDDHFDAIVFGELKPARWMPGSNFFDRTHQDQADWPAETADANTVVQLAIVYRGNDITVYRNAKQYAAYRIGGPQTFGEGSFVDLGLRHVAANNEAWFAGAVLDARIYNLPLSVEQIAALKPNQPSEPKPLAWWNFATGKAEDCVGTFPNSKLYGAAKVAGGRLLLDGRGSYLVSARGEVPGWKSPAGAAPNPGSGDLIVDTRAIRDQLLADPYRPGYHFVTPEGSCMPFDPNGAIFWKGRYHLFYIFQDRRGHNWGHVSSTDLFHWRHHPTGLVSGMFSGNCFVNKDGRPTMCYHQVGQGNAMAVALDDDLNEWKKLDSNPITPKTQPGDPHHGLYSSWDPYGWLEDGTYYAIFGGKRPAIAKSASLEGPWTYVGDLMANSVQGVSINEDVSCADLFQIGNKRMLLCISHALGCRYYLGEWKNEQFHPAFHEKMSWVDNSFFAPESLLDDQGRRIMWAWIFDSPGFKMRLNSGWSGTMSLPRVLTLGEDGMLRMNPPPEIERLRYNEKKRTDLSVPADADLSVEGVAGNSMELNLTIRAKDAKQFGVKVCCSPDGQEQTLVYYDAVDKKLKIDTTQSSLREGAKTVEAGPLELKADEPLQLRVFVDKSVVEVFANGGRQAVMRRIYPSRPDSVGVVLFSKGGPAGVATLQAWDMMPSNPF